jgi:hypothetical protein
MTLKSLAANVRSSGHHWSQRVYIGTLRLADRTLGPGILTVLVTPLIAYRFIRHFSHYFQFRKLRSAFRAQFWKGTSSYRHFWRTFADWTGSTTAILFYDRFGAALWKARFTVHGKPPQALPEWRHRPFVIVFLHSGGYPILKSWMRAQRTETALFSAGIHAIHTQSSAIRKRGDEANGLPGVADTFAGKRAVMEAVRFLKPGRALLISLEQRDFSKPRNPYAVDGATICLDDGAYRIAGMTGALLIPVAVRHRGVCRFEIEFGTPVEPKADGEDDGASAANGHLIRELWHGICAEPAAMTWTLMEALAPHLIGGRGQWP